MMCESIFFLMIRYLALWGLHSFQLSSMILQVGFLPSSWAKVVTVCGTMVIMLVQS